MLWTMFEPNELSLAARNAIADPNNILHVSICSLWEIVIKVGIRKMSIPGSDINTVIQNLDAFRIRTLPIRPAHLLALQLLPRLRHRDPFDRLMVAQAQAEGMTFVTRDSELRQYSLKVLW
jgi:PIN domain nuclease of toxin-antitoxin system